MSREIKYRQLVDGNWYEFGWLEKDVFTGPPKTNREKYPTVQFTGFNDDDGEGCYEGDLIRSSFGIPGRVIESVVYFDKGQFMTRCVNSKVISPQVCTLNEFVMHLGQFWIIGSIHQNPELLK